MHGCIGVLHSSQMFTLAGHQLRPSHIHSHEDRLPHEQLSQRAYMQLLLPTLWQRPVPRAASWGVSSGSPSARSALANGRQVHHALVHEATLVPSIISYVQGVTASFSGTGEAQELPPQVGSLVSMHLLQVCRGSFLAFKACTTHELL